MERDGDAKKRTDAARPCNNREFESNIQYFTDMIKSGRSKHLLSSSWKEQGTDYISETINIF